MSAVGIAAAERILLAHPIYDYRIIESDQVLFDPNIRAICAVNDCGQYDRRWVCPSAVGAMEKLREGNLAHSHAIVFSTASDVSDIVNFDEDLQVRGEHEELTVTIARQLEESFGPVVALSTGCYGCRECTWPDAACRFPDKALPPVEAHGINLMVMNETLGMDWYFGTSVVLYFSIVFVDLDRQLAG